VSHADPASHEDVARRSTSVAQARLPFADRAEGGRALARCLSHYQGLPVPPVVLALPRGGVPVAFEVARFLHAPLDVWVVRKLGLPGNEEIAIGAVAGGGVRVLDPLARGVPADELQAVITQEQCELARREQAYRAGRPACPVGQRTVLLVDDGVATGATMEAAVRALRRHAPARVCVAVPVASRQACQRIAALVDELVCAARPEPFGAVSLWYGQFPQTEDAEVCRLLACAGGRT
jgi:putative phosphoribosyl transferase